MNQDKMHLINKIFNNKTIRTIWDEEEEKYYISVVDVVGVLSGSEKASDGKYYNTDVVDIEGMFRIIESIPSKNAKANKIMVSKIRTRKNR